MKLINNLENLIDDMTCVDEVVEKSGDWLKKNCKDWLERNYKDFLIFNMKLLIAEGVSSVTAAATGEVLGNHLENKLLVTGGTMAGDGVGYLGTYAFTDYLERRGAFAKRMGRFGIAYMISGGVSLAIKFIFTYYYNKKGYSGGESSLMARLPATGAFLLLMNTLGYIMGLVGKEEKKTL